MERDKISPEIGKFAIIGLRILQNLEMLTYKILKSEYVYSSNISQDTCRKLNLFMRAKSFQSCVTLGPYGSDCCALCLWIPICSHKLSNSI